MSAVQDAKRKRNIDEGRRSGYCLDNYCSLFNVDTGGFDPVCGGCSEFNYYFWLVDNGHVLVPQFPGRKIPKF